ncbi:2-dehydropantoate 2-reductase [Streptomyces caniferus]|uniref:2-dehydropantoate 2-reductase n=1 Tax=Streptomyces caniferus TaxID=285557 RepID=A0A640S5T3_9ACTN|nr:2-dehydropantoate 2-reductase [Streptomyces caniferus]GFE06174.1 putative 2-dehydropantoate 2-reductase [Streptomyces caniferus]
MTAPAAAAASPRLAVIGAGAVGGFVAAHAQAAGLDTTLCTRTPRAGFEVHRAGRVLRVPVRCATRPEDQLPFDWLLLAIKAQDTAGAAPWLRHLVGPGTVVAVLQNGVGQDRRVAPLVAAGTCVLPVVLNFSTEQVAPGRIVHHAGGQLVVPDGVPGRRLAALFRGSGLRVTPEADFTSAAWRKLLANLAANPLTALLQQRNRIFADPDVRRLCAGILDEGLSVARAEGANLGADDVSATLAMYERAARADGGTTMLYDRLAGRPLEHEFITGEVVEAGLRNGIPTPLNRALLTMLRAVDRSQPARGRQVSDTPSVRAGRP